MAKAHRLHDIDQGAGTVLLGILGCDRNRDPVIVACEHLAPPKPRGRNRERAGAGTEIKHAGEMAALRNMIEHDEAALRAHMMRGAEGLARVDLDGIAAMLVAPMAAMDDEAPGAHAPALLLRQRDPI